MVDIEVFRNPVSGRPEAVYVRLSSSPIAKTYPLDDPNDPSISVDQDAAGRLVGVEFLSLSAIALLELTDQKTRDQLAQALVLEKTTWLRLEANAYALARALGLSENEQTPPMDEMIEQVKGLRALCNNAKEGKRIVPKGKARKEDGR